MKAKIGKKQPNKRGQVYVALEDIYQEVVESAKRDSRSISKQVRILVREALERRKPQSA